MSVVSGSNLARAFMVSADDVINTRRVISEPLNIEMGRGAAERQTLFSDRGGFYIGFCLEARKIGVSQKHALAMLQHKGAEITKTGTEWLVATSLGGAETAISLDDLATVLDAYIKDGAPAFNVIHIPSIRSRVDRAVRLTAADIGLDPDAPSLSKTEKGWSGAPGALTLEKFKARRDAAAKKSKARTR